MTPVSEPNETELALVGPLVAKFTSELAVFESLSKSLRAPLERPELANLYHSIRHRVKNPEHLQRKLLRKLRATPEMFDITPENLSDKVNDLLGVRILHLHTGEFQLLDRMLRALLEEESFKIREGPVAKTWDDEYRDYFKKIGVETEQNERLYTSVHYVVEFNTRTLRTAEIQVRTLAEELWGEVDHKLNYPAESHKLACREQIRVLARVTSSCTRLVDAIFRTHEEP